MCLLKLLSKIVDKGAFNIHWTCNNCGDEIFESDNEKFFCRKCKDILPFNDGNICLHCGRKTIQKENFCLTCKDKLVSLDICRSPFYYDKPISTMIKKFKYNGAKYLCEVFTEYLVKEYEKNEFDFDYITFVPMTEKACRKRGYNQSKLLAEGVSNSIGVPLFSGLLKKFDTKRQATLGAKDRLQNLIGAYKVTDKNTVKDRSVLIVDDVTTTGATAETLAKELLRVGAKRVGLLTVASLPDNIPLY